jgi:hypothetical protein
MSERSLVFTSLRIDHLQSGSWPEERALWTARNSKTLLGRSVADWRGASTTAEQATGTVRRRGEDRVQISDEEGEREDCRGEGDRHSALDGKELKDVAGTIGGGLAGGVDDGQAARRWRL